MISLRQAKLTDAIPATLAAQPWAQALAYAEWRMRGLLLEYAQDSQIYTALDTCPEMVLDALAVSWKVDWYDTTYQVEVKRSIIRRRAGTVPRGVQCDRPNRYRAGGSDKKQCDAVQAGERPPGQHQLYGPPRYTNWSGIRSVQIRCAAVRDDPLRHMAAPRHAGQNRGCRAGADTGSRRLCGGDTALRYTALPCHAGQNRGRRAGRGACGGCLPCRKPGGGRGRQERHGAAHCNDWLCRTEQCRDRPGSGRIQSYPGTKRPKALRIHRGEKIVTGKEGQEDGIFYRGFPECETG